MNKKDINYTKYTITSSTEFDTVLNTLKEANYIEEIKKLYKIIDEIILDEDMYNLEDSRNLKINRDMYHIHLDGRTTGDIILLYEVRGKNIHLDLKLYNITDHEHMNKYADPKFTETQKFSEFNVIEHKFEPEQIAFVKDCYTDILSDPEFYKFSGERKQDIVNEYISRYIDLAKEENFIDEDGFYQILHYLESTKKKKVLGGIELGGPAISEPLTSSEQQLVLDIFDRHEVEIRDLYLENEKDYDVIYNSMYIICKSNDRLQLALTEADLYELSNAFNIGFSFDFNNLGRYGKTYRIFHYFK